MAARSLWKGFLRINLVSLPVKAYSASPAKANEVHLNQLHAECNSRIKYKKSCPIHGDVPNDEIVTGYEFAKDQYVIVDVDEVDKMRTADEKGAIAVDGFVPSGAIDALYFTGKNYYLVPDGPVGQRAYQVVRQGLLESGKAAVARVVMHGKDQYVVLRPAGDLLAMSVLTYADQVVETTEFSAEVATAPVDAEELRLVKALIASSSKPFDNSTFKDHYAEKLTQLIQAKVDGKEVAPPTEEPMQVINLMEALRKSVANSNPKPKTKSKPKPKGGARAG